MLSNELLTVCTKVKAMYGKRIKNDGLLKLFAVKDYFSAVNYLKTNTNYSECLYKYNLEQLDRISLEEILLKQYCNVMNRLSFYIKNDYERLEFLYKQPILKNEIITREYFKGIEQVFPLLKDKEKEILEKQIKTITNEIETYNLNQAVIIKKVKKLFETYFRFYDDNIIVIVAFSELFKIEIKSIITILEIKWYGLDLDASKQYIDLSG